jgi:hypothetical protein
VLAALTGAVWLSGCAGGLVSGTVENRIEERLPEIIGPARSYDVAVDGPTRQIMQGKIRKLVIDGKDVWVLPELYMDRLTIRMQDVVADRETSTIKSVGDVGFEAVISEKSLNEYLARTRSDSMKVELLDDRMVVLARPTVLRVPVNVRLTGHLVTSGLHLVFRIDQLQVIGVSAPSVAADMVEDRINPVLDLGQLDFVPRVKSLAMEPGAIKIAGSAVLTGGILRKGSAANLGR